MSLCSARLVCFDLRCAVAFALTRVQPRADCIVFRDMLVGCWGCLSLAQVRRELVGDTEPVTAVAVSPDDETVVVASRSRLLRLYDWTTGVVKRSFKVVLRPPPTHSTHTNSQALRARMFTRVCARNSTLPHQHTCAHAHSH